MKGRCHRRKMMGRGAEGGCGTEEKACPISRVRVSKTTTTNTSALDFYVQAKKALSEKSPFDAEEVLSRVSTLPVGLSLFLSRFSGENRWRKRKKSHHRAGSESGVKLSGGATVTAATPVTNIWLETEDYFRRVTLADIDTLAPSTRLDSSDPCLSIPLPLISEEQVGHVDSKVVAEVEENAGSSEKKEHLGTDNGEHSNQTEIDQLKVPVVNGRVSLLPEKEGNVSVSYCNSSLLNSFENEKKVKDQKRKSSKRQSASFSTCSVKNETDDLVQKETAGSIEKELGSSTGKESANSIEKEAVPTAVSNEHGRAVESSDMVGLWSSKKKLLSLERPTKKRKISSNSDGSSGRPVVAQEGNAPLCHVCGRGKYERSNRVLVCDSCNVAVHPKCYGAREIHTGKWLCSWCSYTSSLQGKQFGQRKGSSVKPCLLCPNEGGALKPVAGDDADREHAGVLKFAHLFCSLWVPEVYVENTEMMEPIMNVENIKETRKKLSCYLCRVKHGACIRCSHGTCRTSFHPLCAREAKERMEILGNFGSDNVEFRAFCSKHSGDSSIANSYGILPINRPCKLKVEHNSTEERQFTRVDTENISLSDPPNLVSSLKKLGDRGKAIGSEVAGTDSPNDIPAQCLPPKRRIKGNRKALIENKLGRLVGEPFDKKKGTGMSCDEIGKEQHVHDENDKNDATDLTCLDQDYHIEGPTGKIALEAELSGHPTPNSSPLELLPGDEGNPLKSSTLDSSEALKPLRPSLETAVPLAPENGHANEGNTGVQNPCVETCGEELTSIAIDAAPHGVPELKSKNGESSSSSYVHPYIHERLKQMQNTMPIGRKSRRLDHDVQRDNNISFLNTTSPGNICTNHQLQQSISADIKHTPDAAAWEQLDKARNMGILDLSPGDEVEGEILYFQNRLLDIAVANKRYCEDLIFRVVPSLLQELNALRKQRWDLVLINQFLCEVREAKKQGRKEKRYKEAQAILAAATAAAAASSRISSFRKDAHEDGSVLHHESPLKVNTVSGRTGTYSQLMPRAKETLSRLAVAKVSSEKHSDNVLLDFPIEHVRSCDICRRSEAILNRILVCCTCKVAVHLDCYHILKKSLSVWYCELCEELVCQGRGSRNPPLNAREKAGFVAHCGLCGGSGGAFRKCTDGQWVHAFCAEWALGSTFRRGQPNLVEGMEAVPKENLPVCCICHCRLGVCIRCSFGHCQSIFHPYCARNAGLFMKSRTVGGKVQHKAYCERHSLEQREKAEAQQYGTEELKNIKQIRVELERVRLLCERIIRREKLKIRQIPTLQHQRELVLCSHDILASKRDLVAFSVLFHSSFLPPDVSSGSVTTSLRGQHDDNKSWSEAIQKSEVITVDSTASGKRRDAQPPVHVDIDRKTDDSSTSQQPSIRKPGFRAVVSGKTLPHRLASGGLWSSTDDGEKKSKSRKHLETLQKELVMTSDQASMQNQRLPKGFAYVPIGCLAKEKPKSQDAIEPEGFN